LDEYALEPGRIELELTERSILQNAANARQLLNELRAHGIKIALDDFGTGYNSLLGLVSIPVDYLKIDRAFIDHIQDRVNQVMIESIMDFAHKTGKQVIAEGVEEQEQLELLQRMGCDYIQGYYFSKPLPPEEVKNYMLEAGFP
jgi:EAL domain-containing protein (putative c-di-GMP-specific phosphodiesterase class I)